MRKGPKEYSEDALILGDEDREYLNGLTDTEREKVLYGRFKKINEVEEKRQLLEMERPSAPQKKVSSARFEDCAFVVGRDMLAKNAFKPFFSMFQGCFVRVMLNGRYSICRIASMKENEIAPYALTDDSKRKTSISLNLDTGTKIHHQFSINLISSRGMREEEFEEFVGAFDIRDVGALNTRYRKVAAEMGRDLTDEELTKTIENRLKQNPRKMSNAQKKIDIILKRDAAVAAKNKSEAFRYQQMLESMEDSEKEKKRREELDEMEEARKRLRNH